MLHAEEKNTAISRGDAEARRVEYAELPHEGFAANPKKLWELWMERSSALGQVSRPRELFSPRLRASA
jgi:hypothetical protein